MITLFILLVIIAVALFFVMNSISAKRLSEVNALESQKRSLESKLEFMLDQRNKLRREIVDKERKLTTLKNSQEGIKTYSARDLDITDENDDEKVSRYLIQQGKISLEQNEKVFKKIDVLKMDFISTCLALGYIDLKTAQKALKVNKITSNSLNIHS